MTSETLLAAHKRLAAILGELNFAIEKRALSRATVERWTQDLDSVSAELKSIGRKDK